MQMLSDISRMKKVTSDILISARKMKGMTQNDVSKTMGIAQSTLSRIEAKKLVPSIFLWLDISKMLDIPGDAIVEEAIDKETDAEVASGKNENGYSLLLKYSTLKCLKVRYLRPILLYIKDTLGETNFEDFCDYLNINRSFFANLDNQVNLLFLEDILKYLEVIGLKVNQDLIKEVVKNLQESKGHGRIFSNYKKAVGQHNLIKKYVASTSKYQDIFNYKIEPTSNLKELNLMGILNPRLKGMLNEKVISFLEMYTEESFKAVSLLDFKNKNSQTQEATVTKEKSLLSGENYFAISVKF